MAQDDNHRKFADGMDLVVQCNLADAKAEFEALMQATVNPEIKFMPAAFLRLTVNHGGSRFGKFAQGER